MHVYTHNIAFLCYAYLSNVIIILCCITTKPLKILLNLKVEFILLDKIACRGCPECFLIFSFSPVRLTTKHNIRTWFVCVTYKMFHKIIYIPIYRQREREKEKS